MNDMNRSSLSALIVLTCAASALLSAGCKKDSGCTPGATSCLGTRGVLICPDDGSAWASYDCASWETCKAGACAPLDGVAATCTVGQGTCLNDHVLSVCVVSGLAPAVMSCEEGETCKDGVCAAAAPCTAGATQCVGGKLMRTCTSDGLSWVASACASDEACLPASNSCGRNPAVACTSADNDCVDGVPFVCKKDGTAFDTTPCPANTHCVGAGRCQGNGLTGCVIGTSCSDNWLVTCTDGKTASYTACAIQHACVVDSVTRLATCKLIVCSPGGRECGNRLDVNADRSGYESTCKSDGSGWLVAKCENGSFCRSALGRCSFDCTPTDMTCSDNSVVTCGPLGLWDLASVYNCGDGQTCLEFDPANASWATPSAPTTLKATAPTPRTCATATPARWAPRSSAWAAAASTAAAGRAAWTASRAACSPRTAGTVS